jgi:hypothetical protein
MVISDVVMPGMSGYDFELGSKEARRRSRKPNMETTVERIVIMPATVGLRRKTLQLFSVLRSFEQAAFSCCSRVLVLALPTRMFWPIPPH